MTRYVLVVVTHVGSLEICEVFASISCRLLLAADLVWWVLVTRGLFIKMRKTIDKTMQNIIYDRCTTYSLLVEQYLPRNKHIIHMNVLSVCVCVCVWLTATVLQLRVAKDRQYRVVYVCLVCRLKSDPSSDGVVGFVASVRYKIQLHINKYTLILHKYYVTEWNQRNVFNKGA